LTLLFDFLKYAKSVLKVCSTKAFQGRLNCAVYPQFIQCIVYSTTPAITTGP